MHRKPAYDATILQNMTLPPPHELTLSQYSATKRRFIISYSIPNPYKSGTYAVGQRLLTDQEITKTAKQLINELNKFLPRECRQHKFLLKYNNILYEDSTLEEMGVKNDTVVELECLTQSQLAAHNEGFLFMYWSSVPLIIAISFMFGALIGRFDMLIRSVYMLISTIVGIPAIVFMILGLTETYPKITRTSIVGQYWFGLDCCASPDDESDTSEDIQSDAEAQSLIPPDPL
ncbi:hypothetical protein TVAG_419950 [Trichomonas vaginalis G3]|uniref:Ubiquitin-like domain-containing protein n=1 Tax=Trichomonas vaginalis (strain ATCC PRA-98 / G3) TaxID=412133 RepID=A2GAH7_TRIV3|nr:hypothetical protein TVAGG3_0803900 [Trichomonas vaginalis G3]EAX85843.1 hypothetical protein TVAG_419950 [Trichomonas vaginalis G3]KAI5496713.1 hypothetical protein TVAGG3_0803900 [Trichomonas vaginalis G3]|eukprot:XP_001298773.1 hypothetical protein [Trichomonas vaginalis G3]